MLTWFDRKASIQLKVDIHSHLLPGIDDGVNSYDEAIEILRFFEHNGYKKVVTTPHIYSDLFPNTPEAIQAKLSQLQERVKEAGLAIQVEAAAEYFIDHHFLTILQEGRELLSFGTGYVLVETAFASKPLIFDEVIFALKSNGYIPVLGHPERYEYLNGDPDWLKQIKQQGVLLQLSLPSLIGAYGPAPQKIAKKLLKHHLVDFLGSDIHRSRQLPGLLEALGRKIKPHQFLNNELI